MIFDSVYIIAQVLQFVKLFLLAVFLFLLVGPWSLVMNSPKKKGMLGENMFFVFAKATWKSQLFFKIASATLCLMY